MKRIIIAILTCIGFSTCNDGETTKIERIGNPTIYDVQDNDKEMNEAIKTANQEIEKFNKAFESKNPDFKYLALKIRFNAPNGGEHIWAKIITFEKGKYIGVVDNLPESTTDVKINDTIQINNNNISDWMYIDKGKLCGGYTIRALRNRMNVTEKKQFDAESELIIEE
jgi:uncharacterized protein YegJ (DUF2314 family)